jgi:Tfp pilus assembly protein PilW
MNVRLSRLRKKSPKGYSLLEALTAMAVGLIVIGAGFMLFQQASSTSGSTMSKAEMEQNGRAALNFMMQDISVAAVDYQQAGIGVPQTGAVKAVFGCAGCNTSTYLNNQATPIMPYDKNSLNGTSDTITVIYVDNTWPPTGQTVVTNNFVGRRPDHDHNRELC